MEVRASVIICTRSMRDLVLRCLESVTVEVGPDWEVIVVVNSDSDGTAHAVRQRFSGVRLIVNEANRGVAAARNQGLAIARGEAVILLDADTVVMPGALTGLVVSLLASPDVGLVGPRLMSPDGRMQFTARSLPTLMTKLGRRAPALFRRLPPSDAIVVTDGPLTVGYVIGACQCIRRDALATVGLLDERIFYGPEDVDYCLRLWRAGWSVVYDPSRVVIHHEQRITKHKPFSVLMVKHAVSMCYFFLKHRYLFRAPTYGSDNRNAVGRPPRAFNTRTSKVVIRRE